MELELEFGFELRLGLVFEVQFGVGFITFLLGEVAYLFK